MPASARRIGQLVEDLAEALPLGHREVRALLKEQHRQVAEEAATRSTEATAARSNPAPRQACGDGGLITLKTRIYRQFTVGGNRHKLVCALHISDNGPGVPDDLLPMLFLPMVTGNAKGTGLGLSIAQRIANQHGGLIQVHSAPGDTCFTLLLPMET